MTPFLQRWLTVTCGKETVDVMGQESFVGTSSQGMSWNLLRRMLVRDMGAIRTRKGQRVRDHAVSSGHSRKQRQGQQAGLPEGRAGVRGPSLSLSEPPRSHWCWAGRPARPSPGLRVDGLRGAGPPSCHGRGGPTSKLPAFILPSSSATLSGSLGPVRLPRARAQRKGPRP